MEREKRAEAVMTCYWCAGAERETQPVKHHDVEEPGVGDGSPQPGRHCVRSVRAERERSARPERHVQ